MGKYRQDKHMVVISTYVPVALRERLDKCLDDTPYPTSISRIVVRGLELALQELEEHKWPS